MQNLFCEHIESLCAVYNDLLNKYSYERVLIHSGVMDYYFLDDIAQPFRSIAHFNHWVPLGRHPNCVIEYCPGERPRLYYYQAQDYWHGTPAGPEGFWVESFDICIVSSVEQLAELIAANKKKTLYLGKDTEKVKASWKFTEANELLFVHELHLARTVKTRYEQVCIQGANGLALGAHAKVKELFCNGASELEIHLAYLQTLGVTDNDIPYPNIVGINEKAAILHYTDLRARSVRNDSMLIDAGALCNGYASDITRTYCKDETSVFAELIRALDVKQLEIREMLRPGTDYVDIHLFAHRCIAQLLSDFGIVKAKADEIVEKGLSKVFFPHGVGHHLGLQVHDAGGYLSDTPGESIRAPDEHPFLRCTRTVEAGNVHTIEPGLYFIEMLLDQIDAADKKLINWDLIEELKVFGGIRIEDNICTLADRSVNYTRGQEKLF